MQADDVSDDMSSETAHETLPDGDTRKRRLRLSTRAVSARGGASVALYVFGSTVRGEASGQSSDVDVLIVLDDDVDRETVAESLRDIALDVIIEYGPAVETTSSPNPRSTAIVKKGIRSSETFFRRVARMPDDDSPHPSSKNSSRHTGLLTTLQR